MAHGVNVRGRFEFGERRLLREPSDEVVERGGQIGELSAKFARRLLANVDGDGRCAANAFDEAAAEAVIGILSDAVDVRGDELKFESGASGVQHKDVHGWPKPQIRSQPERKTLGSKQSLLCRPSEAPTAATAH